VIEVAEEDVKVEFEAPRLLVEWSSPWEEFRSSLKPAMGHSPRRLAGEAQSGLFPYRGILITWAGEILLGLLLIGLPLKLASMRPYQPPPRPKYDVIYYSGDELPQTEDLGGAESGRSGRAGGQEAFHRTQTIRVARGDLVRERVVDAPNLKLPHSDSAVQNLLAYARVPGPPPSEGMKSSLRSMTSPASIVAPPPEVLRDKIQAKPSLAADAVAPAPVAPQRDLPSFDLPGAHATQIVPPPVSAPVQDSNQQALLRMPAPAVVAPPPTQVPREVTAGPGFGSGELHKQVVPPPAQLGNTASQRQGDNGLGNNVAVVPPPVQLADAAGERHPVGGLGGGASVVPPPPSLGGGNSVGGSGRGNSGNGRGGVGDIGDAAAPPTSGGNNNGAGVVISGHPGPHVGIPGGGGLGALAMSPTGGANTGLGGSGGGSSIGHGTGPGSGFGGEGSGAGRSGVGAGSDPNARGGISPYPGPGGAGSAMGGNTSTPGVSIRGGQSIVVLPSFGSGNDPQPSSPGRSSAGVTEKGPDITIVASSRSGGAFNYYGLLKGDKVYTTYIPTVLGTAVMEFADSSSAAHPYAEDLLGPRALRADLPAGLPRSRLVIAGVLDRTGELRNLQVLETSQAVMTAKVLAYLPHWKFRPAQRGGKPVEVNAIIGFNIDTNDKF